MGCQRKFTRSPGYSASCVLNKPDGSSYQATLENISIGGASVRVSPDSTNGLNVGDECTVTLCGGAGPRASRYSCEVVWSNPGSLGIQFTKSVNH